MLESLEDQVAEHGSRSTDLKRQEDQVKVNPSDQV